MKKSVLVIGVGRFGRGVIEGLYELGHDVYAIDKNEDALDDVRDLIVSGAIFDVAENDDELSRIVAEKNFDEAVVAMGHELEGALLATHVLIEAGHPSICQGRQRQEGQYPEEDGCGTGFFPGTGYGPEIGSVHFQQSCRGYSGIASRIRGGTGNRGKRLSRSNYCPAQYQQSFRHLDYVSLP